jgi:hypothetical protein
MPRKRVCPEFPGRFGEYPKTLLGPVVRRPPVFGLLASEAEKKRRFEQEENRLRTAFVLKFRLLAKHFEIQWDNSPDMWGQLALELALAHVPGMQIVDAPKRGKGAPPKLFPTIFGRSRFVSEVDAIAAKRKRGIRDAVIVWKSRNKSNDDTEETLRGRYYRELRRDKVLQLWVRK